MKNFKKYFARLLMATVRIRAVFGFKEVKITFVFALPRIISSLAITTPENIFYCPNWKSVAKHPTRINAFTQKMSLSVY